MEERGRGEVEYTMYNGHLYMYYYTVHARVYTCNTHEIPCTCVYTCTMSNIHVHVHAGVIGCVCYD